MRHKSDSNDHEGATLSLSPPARLSTRTLSPPNKHFTCFTTFRLYVEIHFYTVDGPGPRHRPLVPGGLGARIQRSHGHSLTSISGWGTKIVLQDPAGRGHPRTVGYMHTPSLHSFSNLGISLDATTLLSCSVLIFYDTCCLGQQLSKIQLPKAMTSSKEIQCILKL